MLLSPRLIIDQFILSQPWHVLGAAGARRWLALTQAGERPATLLGQRPGRFPGDFAALTKVRSALRRFPDGPSWPRLPMEVLVDV